MFPYLPQSEDEVRQMLDAVGLSDIDDLFTDIPEAIRLKEALKLPHSMAEADVFSRIEKLAGMNSLKILFAGAGQYDHIIPAALPHLAGRSEFVSSYTPYQAEISQGILQALFDFQSCMAEISGLPVSNASLYDGFTAASEACAMMINARRGSRVVLIARTVHPYIRQVVNTTFKALDVEIRLIEESGGRIDYNSLKTALDKAGDQLAGVLVQTPNIYGALENLEGWADEIHARGGRLAVSCHPLSPGALRSPAEWGADLAVGDTQPLGLPPYFGGPSAGFITCRQDLMRRMPGRIVGETVDTEGQRAFVLTLQAREQHIKRERATSNICTNQSLAALANTVYLSLIGAEGFAEVSERNLKNAAYLRDRLTGELKLKDYCAGSCFNEFTLKIPVPRERWDGVFDKAGILSGVWLNDLDSSCSPDLLTIAVTEKRSLEDMECYMRCAGEALK